MTRMNWGRQKSQARMQRYGSEDVRGADIPFSAPSGWSGQSRRSTSKSDLATNCTADKVLTVSCTNCPYTAIVTIPLRPGLRFRCSQCGAVGTLAKKLS